MYVPFSAFRTGMYSVQTSTYMYVPKSMISYNRSRFQMPIWSRYCKKYRDIQISEPKKTRCHSRCVCNITIYRYRVLPTSGVFPDIGDDRRPPRAACSTGQEATVQALQVVQPVGPQLCRPKGQCLGYCLHACAQRATAEIALVSGGATYSESLAKLET